MLILALQYKAADDLFFGTGRSRTIFTAPGLDIGHFLDNQIAWWSY